MNDHMWKKCGEVKAFAETNMEFLKKAKPGLRDGDVFTADEVEELIAANRTHQDQIDSLAEEAEAKKLVADKAAATKQKLTTLEGEYLTDEEDYEDPMELLEWSGFFHGGAVTHWSLVIGAARASDNSKLAQLADGGYKFHQEVLNAINDNIEELGSHS